MNRSEIDAIIKKNIGTIVLIGGVLGVFPLLMTFATFDGSSGLGDLLGWLFTVKPQVRFEFFSLDFLGASYFSFTIGYLWLPMIFYGIMIAGYFSLKSESPIAVRFIRFTLSVIFISHLIGIIWMIFGIATGDYYYGVGGRWILGVLFQFVWIYIAFTILRSGKEEVGEFDTDGFESEVNLEDAPIGSRFLHHLIDTIIYIGICSGLIMYFGESYIFELEYQLGTTRLNFFIIAIIARLLYYPVFETLFGATPGKYLTGSKVVNEDGREITFNQSLARTFSRMVPFEPFSFLGKNKGWHDAWTKTKVVSSNEKSDFSSDNVIDDF